MTFYHRLVQCNINTHTTHNYSLKECDWHIHVCTPIDFLAKTKLRPNMTSTERAPKFTCVCVCVCGVSEDVWYVCGHCNFLVAIATVTTWTLRTDFAVDGYHWKVVNELNMPTSPHSVTEHHKTSAFRHRERQHFFAVYVRPGQDDRDTIIDILTRNQHCCGAAHSCCRPPKSLTDLVFLLSAST